MPKPTDRETVYVENHGSIALVGSNGPLLDEWMAENVSDDCLMFGPRYVVEPRYLMDLIGGLLDAGFIITGPRLRA